MLTETYKNKKIRVDGNADDVWYSVSDVIEALDERYDFQYIWNGIAREEDKKEINGVKMMSYTPLVQFCLKNNEYEFKKRVSEIMHDFTNLCWQMEARESNKRVVNAGKNGQEAPGAIPIDELVLTLGFSSREQLAIFLHSDKILTRKRNKEYKYNWMYKEKAMEVIKRYIEMSLKSRSDRDAKWHEDETGIWVEYPDGFIKYELRYETEV